MGEDKVTITKISVSYYVQFFFFSPKFCLLKFLFPGVGVYFFVLFQLAEDQNVSSSISFVRFKDIQVYDSVCITPFLAKINYSFHLYGYNIVTLSMLY